MNIDDKFIQSFFRVCVKLYKYDTKNGNDIEIKELNEFLSKCHKKLSIIEDNELLNCQITDLTKQINKISSKYDETEKKYVNLYNDLRECRIELKSSNEEKEKLKNNVDELYKLKIKYENDIELKKQRVKQIKIKYNEEKHLWEKILIALEEENNEFKKNNKNLSEQNIKYNNEIKKIDELKKTLCNKFSSDTIDKIDVSIVDMIERANEYEKKYKEMSNQHEILQNNYNDLNDKYTELLKNQTNETNELKQQIKLLSEQIENDRKMYNDNIILMETKKQINGNNNQIQKKGNEENIRFFDVRDKKAIGYFEKDIKLFNENINDIKQNKEPTNRYKGEKISYSTDYMVDLLKVSDKVKKNKSKKNEHNTLETIEEIEISESDEPYNNNVKNNNNNIFMKNKQNNSNENYIDITNMKIINDSDTDNNNKGELKKELDNFILNNNNNNVFFGGGKKKIEIRQIDNKYKMKFDNDYSTLTEQNVNLNDEKTIKKIRHRKYMRHNREKNKLKDLQDEINKN